MFFFFALRNMHGSGGSPLWRLLPSCISTTNVQVRSKSNEVMQARISQQHRDIISVLPPEIIVQILSYTDALSIGCFSTASSTCKALIDQHSQIIYEAIANREFNVAVPCTAGDSGIAAEELPAFALQALEQITANGTIAPTERQLHEAIRYQRTSSTAYDNVRTWKEFGKQ